MKKGDKNLPSIQSELAHKREGLFDFVPAEITLELAGFFSPSSRKLKSVIKEKSFSATTPTGETLTTTLQIIPSIKHGLPITTDFDYYRAFQKVLKDYRQAGGDLDKPIRGVRPLTDVYMIRLYKDIKEVRSMKASIIKQEGNTVTVQLQVQLSKSMLETEENIQEALNEAGCLASQCALEQFDTDGSPLKHAGLKWFSKGKTKKHYETP